MTYETLTPSMNASPKNAMQQKPVLAWKSMGNLSQNNKGKSDREEIREEADRPMLA